MPSPSRVVATLCRVKHVIIIADGAADLPMPELGGVTPFAAARTPNMDRLAREGRLGTVLTTPPGFEAGSDVCSMCLIGYDPAMFHTGRAPLEAAAIGLRLAATDWIFRLNFVTVGDDGTPDAGLMLDHSAGAISSAEGRELVAGLMQHWQTACPRLAADFKLTPGVSYRNILVDVAAGSRGREYAAVRTVPPHEIPRRPWAHSVPRATGTAAASSLGAQALNELMAAARAYLPTHPVNKSRVAAGKRPANAAWIWGQGLKPNMPTFSEKFGIGKGAMITAVDLLAGIAALIGWERVDSPGITSYHDTDYAMQGRVTCEAIERFDIVCSHVESPDEASHQGDWRTKVAGVEAIDQHVVGPVVEHLRRQHRDGWRVLIMPDHYTLVSTRKHDATPPPWLIAGSDVRSEKSDGEARFTEECAQATCQVVRPGDEIMNLFLRGRLS